MSSNMSVRRRAEPQAPRQAAASFVARSAERRRLKSGIHATGLTAGLPAGDLEQFENVVFARRVLRAGERLFGPGDKCNCIYSIHSGLFKTTFADGNGREQVTGFFMPDELLGMDGLGNGCYTVSAMALVDSNVWAMPHGVIQSMAREVPSLHHRLLSALGNEIARNQVAMMMLGTMGARERLVDFLLNVSRRFLSRGYSGVAFRLCMTRSEIGSYLGLSLETVSRHFSALDREGLIEVRQREISILDVQGLERIVGSCRASPGKHADPFACMSPSGR
ncbi:MAG: helix-turn-helix domain-containing protein [Lysobacter sp.]|nr:helix-turn-helix domain-containing protein [Lysobacter sp.]